ncbi:hypothetical protein Rsub_09561 [Raphidocelis subcapitata]|uniref:Uncharacterized protein n=1 Tax=Raphidocelis subcapitata TaxID=307507 RepID=A0A2V0PC24_9CHLO|nr:hypothetical protein Rsub_09561 [Raphidocelis subcapitata]|eukprot:GBF97396.1 hypothetical protein Rsub_09561 [Raphidocelis subcapitata]
MASDPVPPRKSPGRGYPHPNPGCPAARGPRPGPPCALPRASATPPPTKAKPSRLSHPRPALSLPIAFPSTPPRRRALRAARPGRAWQRSFRAFLTAVLLFDPRPGGRRLLVRSASLFMVLAARPTYNARPNPPCRRFPPRARLGRRAASPPIKWPAGPHYALCPTPRGGAAEPLPILCMPGSCFGAARRARFCALAFRGARPKPRAIASCPSWCRTKQRETHSYGTPSSPPPLRTPHERPSTHPRPCSTTTRTPAHAAANESGRRQAARCAALTRSMGSAALPAAARRPFPPPEALHVEAPPAPGTAPFNQPPSRSRRPPPEMCQR